MLDIKCPYCGGEAGLYTGASLYAHRDHLKDEFFYHCAPCKATVSCFPGSAVPKGTLANAKLRKARLRAHEAFDPLWQKGYINRSNAYEWLAKQMRMHIDNCHMALFDYEQCQEVIRICNSPENWI